MGKPMRAFPWARVMLLALLTAVVAWALALANDAVSAWWGAAFLVGVVGTITLGVFFAQLGLFARPIVAAADAGDKLALTFDDGPQPGTTDEILSTLAARGHHATFFVIGQRAEASPEIMSRIVAGGHALGNHSYAHSHATPFLRPSALADELRRAERVLDAARGDQKGVRWFRPPIGVVSPRVARATRFAGLEMVSWTASARDGTARATVDSAMARLRPHLKPGAILVLHDGAEDDRKPIAPELLARLLDELEAKQLRSVTLDELLA
jgi:peptidoglycan/xylan/chitin deacetylase (PgdA/CDA1 family)